MGVSVESLCEKYCPPLEAGLVYALASDFDLDDAQNISDLTKTLDDLKESAVVEQDLELLPQIHDPNESQSRLRPEQDTKHSNGADRTSVALSGTNSHTTGEEDATSSITTGISQLKYASTSCSDHETGSGYGEASIDFRSLSEKGKIGALRSMFPNVEETDIQDILARCMGDFDQCTDELLNISFIRETHTDLGAQEFEVPKGIDGFLQDNSGATHRKTKRKGKSRSVRVDTNMVSDPFQSDSALSSGAATPNVWKDLPKDVEFIASRTYLRPKTITSIYHANGARLAPTIRALAIKEGESYARAPTKVENIIEWQMDELRIEFEKVADAQIYGALVLANQIPSAAKELLDAMLESSETPVLLGKVTGLASYTPVNLSDDEAGKTKARAFPQHLSPVMQPGVYTTSHLANNHGQAATQAFQQASSAYRRGKSDHLMGGAAAYYASVGHERLKAAKSAQAAAANAHVVKQSSSTVLDLHGVNVSDAVRIARNATEAWWEGLGDKKYVVGGRGNGYSIVTGVGRHSSDGIGRIGPAVSKMLVREGWKMEIGRGEIIVSGRVRK